MAVTKCAFLLRNAPAANTPVALSMLAGMAVGAVAIHGSLALPDPWEPRCGGAPSSFSSASFRMPRRHGACRDSPSEPAREVRVRDAPRAPDQDRGARDRACRAYPRAAADELPGSGAIPVRRTQLNAVRPMSRGAVCPYEPPTWPINPERAACRVASRRSRRTECRHASARLTCKSAASCMIRVSYGVNLNPYFSVLRDPAHNRFTVNMVALICVRTPAQIGWPVPAVVSDPFDSD